MRNSIVCFTKKEQRIGLIWIIVEFVFKVFTIILYEAYFISACHSIFTSIGKVKYNRKVPAKYLFELKLFKAVLDNYQDRMALFGTSFY